MSTQNTPEPGRGSTGGGMLANVRDQIRNQINNVIDQRAQSMPDGQKYANFAKGCVDQGLDSAMNEVERRMGGGLGGMMGGMGGNRPQQ